MTPLHYAALYGSPDSLSLLLQAGASPNARTQSGGTALLYAAWSFERTKLLVASGADINAADNAGITPLMVAASAYNNAETVRYLLEHGAAISAVNQFGDDALLRSFDTATTRLLLERGADARRVDKAGFSALNNPLVFRNRERVQMLLLRGADPNVVNTFAGIVKNGVVALNRLSTLMLASAHSDEETVLALLKAGARVNDADVRNMGPLTLAVATDRANPVIVRQLISAGADVNAKDLAGDSVLAWARKFNNPEILSILRSAGARMAAESFPETPQPPAGTAPPSASDAIRRSLPLLTKSDAQFFRASGCVGCHHQQLQAQVFAAAARANLAPDADLRTIFLQSMTAVRPQIAAAAPTLSFLPGDREPVLGYVSAFAQLREPANETTDLIVHYIATRQDRSGAWIALGVARPPWNDSSIAMTARAIKALTSYSWPARRVEFRERVARARAWLETAQAVTTYERADKILGLQAAGVPASKLAAQANELVNLQRADGGWSQTRYLSSDAYATGLVLHTLYEAGLLTPQSDAYRKGIAYLLRTQFPDGSWYVRSRAPKFQPYFQSGFPFEHDQWISIAGTSYATMALAPATSSGENLRSQIFPNRQAVENKSGEHF